LSVLLTHSILHLAQYLLDGAKLHIAAQLFGGWNIGEGSRSDYFSNPFGYLLDGAKSISGWSRSGVTDYQRVSIPSYDNISKDLGDKITDVFFGHHDELCVEIRRMILVCLLSKWDKIVYQIQLEPNGLFKNPRNHFLVSTLITRLEQRNIDLAEFNRFKQSCAELFDLVNNTNTLSFHVNHPRSNAIDSKPTSDPITNPNLFQRELDIQPIELLLGLVTRNTNPRVVLVNFFAYNFIESYKSSSPVSNKVKCKYTKIKAAIRVMTRFLDSFPESSPSLEEADVALNRIKTVLLRDPSIVKTQGKRAFGETTSLHLSIIRANENLLIDKTKSWYRPLPLNTPVSFIEHMYHHKIYDL